MKQLFYKEHLIENKSVRIAENLEKFLFRYRPRTK